MERNKAYQTERNACSMRSATGYCPRPLEVASSFLSKKWTISLIITIGNFGILRFNDIEQRLDGVTSKTLTERLKELEKEKIILRKAYSEIPPRVEYSLTEKGKRLVKALVPLIEWAEQQ